MIMGVIFEQGSKVNKISPPPNPLLSPPCFLFLSYVLIYCFPNSSSLFMSLSNLILPHYTNMKKRMYIHVGGWGKE